MPTSKFGARNLKRLRVLIGIFIRAKDTRVRGKRAKIGHRGGDVGKAKAQALRSLYNRRQGTRGGYNFACSWDLSSIAINACR